LLERHADVHRFVRLLIEGRLGSRAELGLSLNRFLRQARIHWHGVRLGEPDWSDDSHALAATVWGQDERIVVHFMVNAWREALEFQVPNPPPEVRAGWVRWLDTARGSPEDIRPLAEAPPHGANSYRVAPHSVAALVGVIDLDAPTS
jgi:glycogen operon protein